MVESGGKIGAAWRLSELLRQWKCACHVILNGPASVSASALQCGSTCLNHAIRNCRIPMPSSDAKDDETKPRLTNTLQEVRQDLPNRRISKRWLCPRSRRWRVRGSRTPLKGRRRLLCQRDLLGATTTMTTFHCGWLSPPLAAPIPTLKSWPESVSHSKHLSWTALLSTTGLGAFTTPAQSFPFVPSCHVRRCPECVPAMASSPRQLRRYTAHR